MRQSIIIFSASLLISFSALAQGTDGVLIDPNNATTRDASAVFQAQSTSQGVLVPRMTAAQRGAITVDATRNGLMVYQTDGTPGFYYYTGTAWVLLSSSSGLGHIENRAVDNAFGTGQAASYDITGNAEISGTLEVNGSVGLGTTTPSYKLQVQKTSAAAPALMIGGGFAGGPRIQTYGLDADANAWMGLGTDMGGNSYEHSIYYSGVATSRLTFGTYDGTTYTTKATLLNNGNLGIGSATPGYKLDVTGDTRTTGKYTGHLNVDDTRAANTAPTGYNNEVAFDFKQISVLNSAPGSGTFGGLMTMAPLGDNSGDASHQLLFNEGGIYWRQGQPDAAAWDAWSQVLTTAPGGSGTLNYIPKWTPNGSTLGLSQLYDNGTNVGIGSTTPGGKLDVNGGPLTLSNAYLDLNRDAFAKNGLSWYSQSYPSWSTYMSPGAATATGPHGDLTAPSGTFVTSWAMRDYIENAAGYGWTFESAANTTTPAVKFEIRASDGLFHSYGNGIIDGNVGIGTNAPAVRMQINSNFTNLGGRVLTSNQGGWVADGVTPDMVISNTTTNTNRAALIGLDLHNDATTNLVYAPFITFSRRSNSTSYNSAFAAIGAQVTGQGTDANWCAGDLMFSTEDGVSNGLQERMRIISTGNVGIGTTSPVDKLEVAGNVRAPFYYDRDDAGYYMDPNSTSNSALRIRGGALHGPNPTWGKYLLVGGDGRNGYVDDANVASVSTTDGNLHVDAASAKGLYLNFYDGGVINFGNGANGIIGYVNTTGSISMNTGYQISGTAASGNYLRGNGTNFVSSALQVGDLPAHTHTWAQVTAKPAAWLDGANLIADNGNFNNSVPSGFYQSSGATNAPGGNWYNMINVRHSNTGNDHGFQMAMSYYDEYAYTRTYQGGTGANNGTYTPWARHLTNRPGDWDVASNSGATDYTKASIELREVNFGGAGQQPPRLSFHWGGVVASQIAIESDGTIAIRNNPGTAYEKFKCLTMRSNGFIEPSDERLKKNITPIGGALDKIMALQGVTYNWRTDMEVNQGLDDGKQYGLIAQELEKVIPELVDTDKEGWKAVEYSHLVPVLIEAMKEQQSTIEKQQQNIKAQQQTISLQQQVITGSVDDITFLKQYTKTLEARINIITGNSDNKVTGNK